MLAAFERPLRTLMKELLPGWIGERRGIVSKRNVEHPTSALLTGPGDAAPARCRSRSLFAPADARLRIVVGEQVEFVMDGKCLEAACDRVCGVYDLRCDVE